MRSLAITTRVSKSNRDKDDLRTRQFDYRFDETLIATAPMKQRDQSRLLIYHRESDKIVHQQFSSLLEFLDPKDLLVINNTRVFPARLLAKKDSGGAVELLLLRPIKRGGEEKGGQDTFFWETLVKGQITASTRLTLNGGGSARLVRDLGQGRKEIAVALPSGAALYPYLKLWGEVPLPPYILRRRKEEGFSDNDDVDRYQTVYAKRVGSAAAPTAGLHFTKRLMTAIQQKGVAIATVTLHIGTDTFRPMESDRLETHKMGGEWVYVPSATARAVLKTKALGGKVIAVGTSVTRALESAADENGTIAPIRNETALFITPGYRFRVVDALITNLHPPRSTGLVLVSAFAGCDVVSSLYREAMEKRYRFFSYGDAMLIL